MKIFVPGRICLFGEHSDWAGGYRRINSNLEKGYCIVVGTNQGIYAQVKPHPNKFILHTTDDMGQCRDPFEVSMDKDALLAIAEEGGFFSYAAGVAYQILTHYKVNGLEIDNYKTDLPMKKGLSSSAALCVLIARSFNRIYDMKMTVRGEMEYAYRGETTTPARCGRMDQGCAYGDTPILMTFDGDNISIKELKVEKDIHLVIVDLCAHKNTKEILTNLNSCYPFAGNELQQKVQQFLGPVSAEITHEALKAIESSDSTRIGQLMRTYQDGFDTNLRAVSPSQLAAPVLHKVLDYQPIQQYILGGKGVGSQGDGTAQFIVRDEECQTKVIELLENDLGLNCLRLSIKATRKIRKAVITAAGFGTRLFPATKVIRKEFFPFIDTDGRAKPVLLSIVEEALSAGVEEVALIIQSSDLSLFEQFFKSPLPIENYNKLNQADRDYADYLLDLGSKVTFIVQEHQDGFGHAVFESREWIDNEPFLLLLGDHLFTSSRTMSCAQQLIDTYQRYNLSTVGLAPVDVSDVGNFGCVTGTWKKHNSVLLVTDVVEKPTTEYAREHLAVEDMEADTYLSFFGLYALKPRIFDLLEEQIRTEDREGGEIQLTTCLDHLRKEDGMLGFIIDGQRSDIGNPKAYSKISMHHSDDKKNYIPV